LDFSIPPLTWAFTIITHLHIFKTPYENKLVVCINTHDFYKSRGVRGYEKTRKCVMAQKGYFLHGL
jgi:hypothetical protein